MLALPPPRPRPPRPPAASPPPRYRPPLSGPRRFLLSHPRPFSPLPTPFPSPPHPSSPRPSLLISCTGLDPNLRKAILDDICKRLTPTAIKIRADIEVTCFHYEGINAIRSALLKGAELAAPEVATRTGLAHAPLASAACRTAAMLPPSPPPPSPPPSQSAPPPPRPPQHNEGRDLGMKVKLVAPPLYVMTCSALDKARRPRATLPSPRSCSPLPRPAASPRCLAPLPRPAAASCCGPARDSLPPNAPTLQPVTLALHAPRRKASSCSTTRSR